MVSMVHINNIIPMLSVGLAVFNGEKFLRESLDSILAQTFRDFELIISDNASEDATEAICREYAARDSRIRYSRNEYNIGGANNENRTFLLSRGKYFRLAAHDDVVRPTLFERSIEVLEKQPDVVLVHPQTGFINEKGDLIGTDVVKRGEFQRPHERFAAFSKNDWISGETYGIMRSDILRRTRLEQNYSDSDKTLICELVLYGRFHQIPEILYFRRMHPKMSIKVFPDRRDRMDWFCNEGADRVIYFPNWIQTFDYFRVLVTVPLSITDRLLCFWVFFKILVVRGKWLGMGNDLYLGLRKLLRLGGNVLRHPPSLVFTLRGLSRFENKHNRIPEEGISQHVIQDHQMNRVSGPE